jgi:DNA-binding NarL/FixJ family response regulator
MINVLVVDDNEPVRKSLRYLVETADDIKIVATAPCFLNPPLLLTRTPIQ